MRAAALEFLRNFNDGRRSLYAGLNHGSGRVRSEPRGDVPDDGIERAPVGYRPTAMGAALCRDAAAARRAWRRRSCTFAQSGPAGPAMSAGARHVRDDVRMAAPQPPCPRFARLVRLRRRPDNDPCGAVGSAATHRSARRISAGSVSGPGSGADRGRIRGRDAPTPQKNEQYSASVSVFCASDVGASPWPFSLRTLNALRSA